MPASSPMHFSVRPSLKTIGNRVKLQNDIMKRGKSPKQIFPNSDDKTADSDGSNSNHDNMFYQKRGPSIAPPTPALNPDGDGRAGLEDLSTSNPVVQPADQGTGAADLDKGTTGPEWDEYQKLPSKWVVFGPTYQEEDTEVNRMAKESAWQHIVEKKGGNPNIYKRSIIQMDKEVRESYDDSNITDKQARAPEEFEWMMVKDGCFFLQLALHILGGGEHLGHPNSSPYFGKAIDSSSWIPAMFYAGNQIPYIVIQALMKQEFFQDVIKAGTWQRPTEDDMAKLVLYQTVVEPQLKLHEPPPNILQALRNSLLEFYKKVLVMMSRLIMMGSSTNVIVLPEPPANILHALHNLLVGSKDNDPISYEMREFKDLEAGSEDREIKIPSAVELYKLGIKLRKAETGISNIKFKNRGYSAFLFVPPLIIDKHTKDLLTNLVSLELKENDSTDREFTAYIRFMRDLAPTYKDFKILQNKGIIIVKDDKLKGTMVPMLRDLVFLTNSSYTVNFKQIRRKIKEYGGPPWRLISFMLSALTVVQTIFTILSYCIPPRTK